jgi:hypothetical protein
MDDIRTDHAASETERLRGTPADAGDETDLSRRRVGPESEVRGGPEVPKDPD